MNSTLKNILVLAGIVALCIVGYKLYDHFDNQQIEKEAAEAGTSKEAVRNNPEAYITASITDRSQSQVSSLPHIITVHNPTPYTIDSVRIHIEYIHNNGKLWHQQDFEIGKVRPDSDLTWTVDNPIQTKAYIKIIGFRSADLGYPGWKLIQQEKADTSRLRKIG